MMSRADGLAALEYRAKAQLGPMICVHWCSQSRGRSGGIVEGRLVDVMKVFEEKKIQEITDARGGLKVVRLK